MRLTLRLALYLAFKLHEPHSADYEVKEMLMTQINIPLGQNKILQDYIL